MTFNYGLSMTLAQLRHFVEVARLGSFSKAADHLRLTQPALSRSIRALENEVGLALFDRIGRRSELTPFGGEWLGRASRLLADVAELRDNGRKIAEGAAGELTIGMGSGPGAMLMTPLLTEMATRHPRLKLRLSRAGTEPLVAALRERRLDAIVVDARSMLPAVDLRTEELSEMRGAILCRAGHKLACAGRALDFAELLDYPILSTPLSDEVARLLIERYGPRAHPAACVTVQCEEISSLVEVARRTDAILLAIRAAAPDLVELPMDPPVAMSARFALVTLAGRTESPALPIVRRLMRELLRD